MSSISLKSLQSAMAAIADVGRGESTFDVAGTSVTVRLLLPDEEVSVQREASKVLEDVPDGDHFGVLQYMDAFKVGILSRAIIQVDTIDLRSVDYVETGEVLENGKAVKEPKALAMRGMVDSWTRPPRDILFRKYVELMVRIEIKAEAAVSFDPTDLDTEIGRLETRLTTLKEEKAKRENVDKSGFLSQAQAIVERDNEQAGKTDRDMTSVIAQQGRNAPDIDPEMAAKIDESVFGSVPAKRAPIIPTKIAPPPINRPAQQPAHAQVAPQVQNAQAVQQPTQSYRPTAPYDPLADVQDSFADDDDSVDAANRAEAMRRQRLGMPLTNNVLQPQQQTRQPPHAHARQVAAEMADTPEVALPQTDPNAPDLLVLDGGTSTRNPRFINRSSGG